MNKHKFITALPVTSLLISSAMFSANSSAVEYSLHGIIDARLTSSQNTSTSYLLGGYGKFDQKNKSGFSLAQLGIHYQANWQNNISANIVANAFSNKKAENIGISEAYLKYKSLPTQTGWRTQIKSGFFYPTISLENNATAWSNPYTLNNSTLNTWVAEELRSTGIQFTIEKLGKFSKSKHSFALDLSFFQNNDTTGAMLTWHGWTQGSRQSLWQETLKLQNFPARWKGQALEKQAAYSDPFIELDNRWGTHLVGHWRYQRKVTFNLGYYDNNANTDITKNGQYTWQTRFIHSGIKITLAEKLALISQYMHGRTYMEGRDGSLVVDNNFTSGFVMLRKSWQQQQLALRAEEFSVEDLDNTWGDNNQEYGKALTLSYRYRLNKHAFIQSEYNWLQSHRPARYYVHQAKALTERQLQLALRYYF